MSQNDDKKWKDFIRQHSQVELTKPEGEWRAIVAKIEAVESTGGTFMWRRWFFGSVMVAAAALVFGLTLQNRQATDSELADFVIDSQPVDDGDSLEGGFEDDYLSLLE